MLRGGLVKRTGSHHDGVCRCPEETHNETVRSVESADVASSGFAGDFASANTDIKLNAEILSYSRSKGVFAGASVDGAVVQADHSADKAMYGSDVTHEEILHGRVAVPEAAQRLLAELSRYSVKSVSRR